jgi:hypothetical protein
VKKIKDEWAVLVFTRHSTYGGNAMGSTSTMIPGFTSYVLAEDAATTIKSRISFDNVQTVVIKVKEGN